MENLKMLKSKKINALGVVILVVVIVLNYSAGSFIFASSDWTYEQKFNNLPITIFENYNSGDDGGTGLYGATWRTQTFTPATAHNATKIKLKGRRIGSPGTLTVSIKATDVDGKPTGNDLASGTFNANNLTTATAGEWFEIVLDSEASLSASTKYAIVIRALSGDASNQVVLRQDESSPSYAGGSHGWSTDSGSSWTLETSWDLMFEEYGYNDTNVGDLNGSDGWSGDTDYLVQTSVKFEGTKAVKIIGDGTIQAISRAITGISSGEFFILMRITGTPASGDWAQFYLDESGTQKMLAGFYDDGNIDIYDYDPGTLVSIFDNFSNNTWYAFNVQFDDSAQPNKYRVRAREQGGSWGAWSDWIDTNGNYSVINAIYLRTNVESNITVYFDTITPTDPMPPSPSVKVRKSSNESVTNSTTLQADNDLKLSLSANRTYVVDGAIFVSSTSKFPDIKIAFDYPDGATMDIGFNTISYGGLLEGDKVAIDEIPVEANIPTIIQLSGTVKTGASAGDLELWWAQATSRAESITVKEGSYLRAEEL